MPSAGDRDNGNINKTPYYLMKIDIDVENINKNDNNTWRNIYKSINAHYFREVKLFTSLFIDHCKNHPNYPQNIPSEIKRKIKKQILTRKFIDVRVYDPP